MSKAKGLVAAVLAYAAWGPLAPLGALLLEAGGPFTLNAIRTAGSIALLALFMGPRKTLAVLRALARDRRLWILGVVGLGLTFSAYLGSLLFLDPTPAALLLYFSPIMIAWISQRRHGESISPLLLPTLLLTVVGGILTVVNPAAGGGLGLSLGWGLALGILGVLGWVFYTVYLRGLVDHYTNDELTLSAFITSGIAFTLVAIPLEGFAFEWNQPTLTRLTFYVFFASFLSFRLYSVAVRNAGATATSLLIGIELVATAIFSYFLTAESFDAEKIGGLVVVLLAVTAFLWTEARSAPSPA